MSSPFPGRFPSASFSKIDIDLLEGSLETPDKLLTPGKNTCLFVIRT